MATDCTNNGEATKNGLISPNNNFIVPEETNEIITASVETPLTNGLSTSECTSPKVEPDDLSAPPIRDVEPSDLANSMMDADQGDESNNGPKYKCYICDKLFSRNSSLKCHIRLHLEGPVNILRKGSNNRLANESTTMERDDGVEVDPLATASTVQPNEKGLYECHLCPRTFDRKKGLFRHIGYHNSSTESHVATSRVDSLDDAGSDIELSLADDDSMEQEDGGAQFQCFRCNRLFKTHRAMKIHATQAHRDSRADEDEPMEVDDDPSDDEPDEEDEQEEEEENRFECDGCDRVFNSQRARSIHFVYAHKGGDNASSTPKSNATAVATPAGHDRELYFFVCAFCRREFKTCRLMNAHIANEHANHDSYQCVVCERRYDTIRAYSDHGRGICGKAQILNSMYVYACEECPKTFAHPKSMSRHVREHRSEQDQLTHPTQRAESTSEQPEKRDGAATGGSVKVESASYKCAFCTKCYPNVKALAGHMKVHNRANGENSGGSPTTPSNGTGGGGAASSHHHNNHQQAQHAGEDDVRLYPCPHCDRTFTSNVGYAGHMKVHKDRSSIAATPAPPPPTVAAAAAAADEDEPSVVEGEKIFVCRICNKKFTSGVQLGGHMRHHTAAMKAASNLSMSGVAGAVAADVYDALHIDTDAVDVVEAASHHDDDQYICDTCDKTFVCKEELSEHVLYHVSDGAAGSNGGSPFGKVARDGGLLCEYCDRPFNGVKSLKTHMYRYHRSVMMHTAKVEDKVYKCNYCNRKFTYLSELKKHSSGECDASRKRPFAPEDSLRCEYCDQTFMLRCHLQEHMKLRCNAVGLPNQPEAELPEPETMNGDVGVGGGGGGESGDILASKRVRKSTLISSLYEYEPIGGARRLSQKSSSSAATAAGAGAGAGANLRPADFGDEHKPFECAHCDKCFGQQEELMKHVRDHVKSYDLSEEDLNDYLNLNAEEHFVIETEHGDEEHFIFERFDDNEGYQCSECEETYRDKLQMIIHMSFHISSNLSNGDSKSPPSLIIKADSTLLAPHKCKFCNERFINKIYRVRHMLNSHQERVFQCAFCTKLFLYRKSMKQHLKLHMADAKYHCEYCRRSFTSKWFLKRHTKLHCGKRAAAAAEAEAAAIEQDETLVDGGYHCKSEKIETEQADSEIVVDHFIKEEMPTANEVVVHMQMQSV